MFELSTVFLYFLIQQIAVVVFSLVRSKVLAATCGVGGYGLISQANAFVLTLQVIMGAGLGSGFVKLIAQDWEDNASEKRKQIISTMFTLGSITSTAGILLTSLFSKTVSTWIFGSPEYSHYVLICALTSFAILQYAFFLDLFRGLLEWKVFTIVSIASTGVSLIVTVSLILLFNIEGGIWALLLSQICSALIALIYYRLKIRPRHPISFGWVNPNPKIMRLLLNMIGPLVIIYILTATSRLATRSMVIQHLGLEQNGLIQLSTGISDAYKGLILAILMSYILPKIAAIGVKDPDAASQTQNDGLRFCILIITPTLLILLASREIWIPILYSRSFLSAQNILIWQFLGDFFFVTRICLNIDLVPTNRLKYYALDGVLFSTGTILLTITLLPILGIFTVAVSSLLVNLTLTLISLAYHFRRTSFRLSIVNWGLLAKAAGLLCLGFVAAQWIPNLWIRALTVSMILALMLKYLPKREELKNLWQNFLPSLLQQGWAAIRNSNQD
ncbi:MAG: hypothetical protein K8R77_10265 [Anaerolineaceae bacterium]|nr:hypothetical protein [Anaerolineaceae bacterium]